MKYQIVGKNIEITESIENQILKKLSKMDKYFDNSEDISCRALCRSYKHGAKVEVTIFTKMMTFRAEETHEDLYAAVDLTIDKLVGQMRKLKTQFQRRYGHEGLGEAIIYENLQDEEEAIENAVAVRTKSFELDPMSMEEAILRMEALGHEFFMYLDSEDELISVVYKRRDGGYGLIQAENQLK